MTTKLTTAVPRLGDRTLWSTLTCSAYLNHAGIAPLSDPARHAIERVIAESSQRGSLAFGQRVAERERLRSRLASLFGAREAEIALAPNTTYGLGQLALSIPWRSGDRIVVWRGEYPTNVTVFQRAAELFGLSLTFLPGSDLAADGGADLGTLTRELRRGGVRLCAVSAVQFQTGVRAPLAEIAALCHAHGAQLIVDAVQAAGAVPLDVRALGIDYLAAGAHKWLLGADGAGVLYVAAEHQQALRPAITGAMSYTGATDMLFAGPGHLSYERALRADAQVFEGGMFGSVACAAFDASVALILGLGVAEIYRHVNAYLDALEPAFIARGFTSLRLPDAARRSCTLSFRPPATHTAPVLAAALAERGVTCACPDGLLRLTPHWPNNVAELPRILDALDDALTLRA